ncbi:alpha/beta fold hydrolase [Rouxiella sp. Mn2063]|uniref:alpha/beta hydrolase n=1 Tax=Rouxiella sp. Mn2063 TaxID=3395262 RepID=UPI003BD2305C
MSDVKKHTFVLIAGAWHGGWVWRDVVERLRQQGHTVSAPTLTGLGERRHNATPDTNLSTHIDDVLAHIDMEGLENITLVGWSYGGMVITGVAGRIPSKISSLIYLDAIFPESGKSMMDYLPETSRERLEPLLAENQAFPAFPMEKFGITDAVLADFITPRLTLQPVHTFFEPVHFTQLPDVTIGYVYCTGYGESTTFTETYHRLKDDARIRMETLDTHHMMMLSEPQKTTELLLAMAR